MNLIGIDPAWQSEKNTSAAAVGRLYGNVLSIHDLREDLDSIGAIMELVGGHPDVAGLVIDAPLIIKNMMGQRSCEKELSRAYGARKASCHTSNLTLYPGAPSVELGNTLTRQEFVHLGQPKESHWQVECYPHPAIIEIFGLAERHLYKKGNAAAKREGQIKLAELIRRLAHSPVLKLFVDARFDSYLVESSKVSKRGGSLKKNEDVLDAIICTYIAALYASDVTSTVYGNFDEGYIYVIQVNQAPMLMLRTYYK